MDAFFVKITSGIMPGLWCLFATEAILFLQNQAQDYFKTG